MHSQQYGETRAVINEEANTRQVNFSYLNETPSAMARYSAFVEISATLISHADPFLFKQSDTYTVWPWWSRLDPGCIPLLGSSRY